MIIENTETSEVPNRPDHAIEEAEMTYHFYENWTVRPEKAKIHFSNCSFCNCGEGVGKPKEDGLHGTWHGPFATLQEACDAARRTGKPVTTCGHCKPR